jgi:hypothetical protein
VPERAKKPNSLGDRHPSLQTTSKKRYWLPVVRKIYLAERRTVFAKSWLVSDWTVDLSFYSRSLLEIFCVRNFLGFTNS